MMMSGVFAVGIGGAIGAMARYLVGLVVGSSFGTLVVNLIGSFMSLFLIVLLASKFASDPVMRLFLIVGVMGGFTTFSAFSVEVVQFIDANEYTKAFWSFALNNVVSIGAGVLGLLLARALSA